MALVMRHRLQVLLDDGRYERLKAAARHTDRSVGAVIRDAIDHAVPPDQSEMTAQQAADYLLSAPEMPVDDWEDMKRDLPADDYARRRERRQQPS
jgi:plasmid stability protein